MSQILYLNSVGFLFFVPFEDYSCKIHGPRGGLFRASRGWTYQVYNFLVSFFVSPLCGGHFFGKKWITGWKHLSVLRRLDLLFIITIRGLYLALYTVRMKRQSMIDSPLWSCELFWWILEMWKYITLLILSS